MNLWSNIYTYGLTPEETERVRRTFVTDFGYHLYEAEDSATCLHFQRLAFSCTRMQWTQKSVRFC